MVKDLQRLLADEYLAAIQYHNGAMCVDTESVKSELAQHAIEELKHADGLAERIKALGGDPVQSHRWRKISRCGYTPPKGSEAKVLRQNIKGEKCAIKAYQQLLNKNEADSDTKQLLRLILKEEKEHLTDLTDLLRLKIPMKSGEV